MKAKVYFIFILYELLNLSNILCKDCDETDMGHHITKCDSSNKRKVIQFWKNDCSYNPNANITQPKIIENIDCDVKCGQGEYFTYDILQNKITCHKCPANTYSIGGDFRICGEKKEWTEEVLSSFVNVCYVRYEDQSDDQYKLNENCEKWKINPNHKNITTGSTNITEGIYVVELKYHVYMKNPGMISFGYTKKSRNQNGKINGEFKFYVDYMEIVHDKNITDEFIDVSYELERGDHSFLWRYYYTKNKFSLESAEDYSDLKMDLKYIMIENMEDGAYECISCKQAKNSAAFSKEGWNHCESCKFGEYFQHEEQICKECPVNSFSYPNSENLSSCISHPLCNEYDYKQIHAECVEDKIEVKYEWEQPIVCDYKSFQLPQSRTEICDDKCESGYFKDLNSDNKKRCIPCIEGEYSDQSLNPYTCVECPNGSYAPRLENITKFHAINTDSDRFFNSNQCISEASGLCEIYDYNGWKFRKDGIIPGNNLPRWIQMKLVKDINIIQDKGYVEFSYEIFGLKEEEYFEVLVDGVMQNIDVSSSTKHTKRIELSHGKHKIIFLFRREPILKDIFITESNSMIITQIAIYGSDEGGAVECIKCPANSISRRQPDSYISRCIKCENGLIPDAQQSECIMLKEFAEEEESNCPEYSYLDESKRCVLNDIIHNKSLFLRYFLHDLKNINHHNCKMADHKKCKNKFIGPIINQNEMVEHNIDDNEDNDIFYLSLNNKDKLVVKDFTYAIENGICSSGHIFALFEFKNCTDPELHNSNDYQFTSHTKILKNIGSQIDKIILIPGAPYFNNLNPGLAIKYSNGDVCMSNPNLRYSSYIFITCDKSGIYYPPKYIGKLDNNCTYVFEWESLNGCPSCLRKNLEPVANGCFNNTEEIRYEENLNCVIINDDEAKFSGYNSYSNSTARILSKEIMITDPVFSFYFYKKNVIKEINDWENIVGAIDSCLINKNFTIPNRDIYVDYKREKVNCESPYKLLEQLSVLFLIIIPTFYVITSFYLVFFYCKYRRINNDYERLRLRENESNASNIIDDGNELAEIENHLDFKNI